MRGFYFITDAGLSRAGNVSAVCTPDGATTRYESDRLGRLVSITDP